MTENLQTSRSHKNSSYETTKQICKLQTLFLEGEKKVDRIRGETPILQAIKTKFDHELHFLDEQHKKKITDEFFFVLWPFTETNFLLQISTEEPLFNYTFKSNFWTPFSF